MPGGSFSVGCEFSITHLNGFLVGFLDLSFFGIRNVLIYMEPLGSLLRDYRV